MIDNNKIVIVEFLFLMNSFIFLPRFTWIRKFGQFLIKYLLRRLLTVGLKMNTLQNNLISKLSTTRHFASGEDAYNFINMVENGRFNTLGTSTKPLQEVFSFYLPQ